LVALENRIDFFASLFKTGLDVFYDLVKYYRIRVCIKNKDGFIVY